jgi:eukaryotic-like serine/threonine-protein kinase
MRILAGVGAWLFGAGTATAGSLLAVSLLGQGIAASPGQQLTGAAVNRALARESRDPGQGVVPAPPSPVHTSGTARPAATRTTASRPVRVSPASSTGPASSTATAAPSVAALPGPQAAAGTVLTSAGGTVLAECLAAGTYLVSWSPTQGYETSDVTRGPGATARVVFESAAKSVTMTLTCPDGPGGRPVASSSSGSWGGGHDE